MALTCRSVKGLCLMSYYSKMHMRHLPTLISKMNFPSRHISKDSSFGTCKKNFYTMHSDIEKTILSPIKYCDNCASVRHYATMTSRFTLRNETYRTYMITLEQECAELSNVQMMGEQLTKDLGRRLMILRRVVYVYSEVKKKYEELEELDEMLNDDEMKELVGGERQACLDDIQELEDKLIDLICPEERIDECDIILEIESGAGGQEAMLFVEEVFNMYENYAYNNGWQFTRVQIAESEVGMRKASASITGQTVFGEMKYEGGVHRVQRVPKTESKGRIHTSTISVAVLPQPTEIDIVLDPKDLQITTMRASGPGGQSVNKTDSAVRIKHLPTGMVAECQTQRSQVQNKSTALKMLRTRLYETHLKAQTSMITSQRKIQVGRKNRSEKIRTYNFPQDRITDHRLGQNFNNMSEFMTGNTGLGKMIGELQTMAKLENLHEILDEFEKSDLKTKKTKT